jgi:hypothetical protein
MLYLELQQHTMEYFDKHQVHHTHESLVTQQTEQHTHYFDMQMYMEYMHLVKQMGLQYMGPILEITLEYNDILLEMDMG